MSFKIQSASHGSARSLFRAGVVGDRVYRHSHEYIIHALRCVIVAVSGESIMQVFRVVFGR